MYGIEVLRIFVHRRIIVYRFSNVLQALQRDNSDCEKILGSFADVNDVRKLRLEVDNAWRTLRARLEEVKNTLSLAEQLLQYGIGINEVIAFKLAVDEKADMERISRGAAARRMTVLRLIALRLMLLILQISLSVLGVLSCLHAKYTAAANADEVSLPRTNPLPWAFL